MSSKLPAVAHPVEAKVRRARIAGYTVGIGSYVVGFLAYAALKQAQAGDALVLLVQSLYLGGPILGYLVYSRMVAPRALVVWLRRFRPRDRDRVPFHSVLERASTGLLAPVTVQDDSYRTSMSAGALGIWWMFPLALAIWLIGAIFVTGALVFSSSEPSGGLLLIALIAWSLLFAWAAWGLVRRKGVRTLHGADGVRSGLRRLDELRGGAHRLGVEVLKCDDEIWREVVSGALAKAQLAIIDLSDPTAHLLWELSEALKRLDADRVLLALEQGGDRAPLYAAVDAGLQDRHGRALGRDWVERALFEYPGARASRANAKNQFRTLADRLRQELLVRST